MQRIGMVIKLKPGSQNAYKKYHAAVWPEILNKISECNIKNYSVFLKDDFLFGFVIRFDKQHASSASPPQLRALVLS